MRCTKQRYRNGPWPLTANCVPRRVLYANFARVLLSAHAGGSRVLVSPADSGFDRRMSTIKRDLNTRPARVSVCDSVAHSLRHDSSSVASVALVDFRPLTGSYLAPLRKFFHFFAHLQHITFSLAHINSCIVARQREFPRALLLLIARSACRVHRSIISHESESIIAAGRLGAGHKRVDRAPQKSDTRPDS